MHAVKINQRVKPEGSSGGPLRAGPHRNEESRKEGSVRSGKVLLEGYEEAPMGAEAKPRMNADENRSQKSEARSWEAVSRGIRIRIRRKRGTGGVGRGKAEIRSQETEVRSQKREDGGWKMEPPTAAAFHAVRRGSSKLSAHTPLHANSRVQHPGFGTGSAPVNGSAAPGCRRRGRGCQRRRAAR